MVPVIIVLLSIVVIGAVALVVVGLRASRDGDALQSRLGEFLQSGEAATLEEIELSQPFTERIVFPLWSRPTRLSTASDFVSITCRA